jgi:hypothetical protein
LKRIADYFSNHYKPEKDQKRCWFFTEITG